MRRLVVVCVILAAAACDVRAQAAGEPKTYTSEHVTVRYSGIGENYAKALARVAEDARAAAEKDFGFDVPESLLINVSTGGKTRLWTDGDQRMYLTLVSEAGLAQPRKSGTFNIYGVCHEIGHMAMYRTIKERPWMTTAAAEGWAHYLGSRLVDVVYRTEGEGLWPDRYNYLADGTQRLRANVAGGKSDDVTKGGGLWMELDGIVGDKAIAEIFKAWGAATIDPADPGPPLRTALLSIKKDPKLAAWWTRAERVFVQRRAKSAFAAAPVDRAQLLGKPQELALDDGVSAGIRSTSGSGHAVRFETPAANSVLTAVKIFGSRYGDDVPPKENFHVLLCDANFKAIADFPFPYSMFEKGGPKWVTLEVTPTKVPQRFIIWVGFNPTATKGVYVNYDKAVTSKNGRETSIAGTPGGVAVPFARGDWMIRAVVDTVKSGNSPEAGQ